MDKKKVLIIEIVVFILLLIGITCIYNYLINRNNESYIQEDNLNNVKEESKMDIKEIKDSEQFKEEVINQSGTVLIDFYAEWCMPCKMMSPVIEELAKEYDEVKFVKINVDENEDLAIEYNVVSIPTLVVMKNGEVTKTFVGVTSKSDILKELK